MGEKRDKLQVCRCQCHAFRPRREPVKPRRYEGRISQKVGTGVSKLSGRGEERERVGRRGESDGAAQVSGHAGNPHADTLMPLAKLFFLFASPPCNVFEKDARPKVKYRFPQISFILYGPCPRNRFLSPFYP